MVLKDQVGKARCKIMRIICLVAKASLPSNANISLRPDCNSDYAPNFEKVDGAYCFWCVR